MTCSCGADGVLLQFDGVDYCPACYENKFIDCAECGAITHRDDSIIENGKHYCENCFDQVFCHCCNCLEIGLIDDFYIVEGYHYCEYCYNDTFTLCYNCEIELNREDVYYTDNAAYCSDCYPGAGWESSNFTASDSYSRLGSRRRFGVELEVSRASGYESLENETCFGCREDASLPDSGREFVSPILSSDAGLDAIDEFCALSGGFQLDSCCGFHVHLDMQNETNVESIAEGFALMEEIWHCFVPKTRRFNRYCYPIQSTGYSFPANMSDCRQCWLNLYALSRHSTIEIRLHSSTLCAEKICNWVKLNLRFADYCAGKSIEKLEEEFGGTPQEKFDTLCDIVGSELGEYYAQRAKEFGTQLLTREVA